MNNETIEILKALKAGQEYLIAKIDNMDLRLARVEGDVKAIKDKQDKQDEQDKVVDVLAARTTRLQAIASDRGL